MRIAQVSTLSSPVRQDAKGSIEYFIWLLTRELTALGHEVTVFGTEGSQVDGEVVATLPGPYGAAGSLDDWHLCEWVNLGRAIEQSGRFDVIHSHAYLWGLPLEKLSRCPMVHTTHIVPDDNSARLWEMQPQACVTALSKYQWSVYTRLQPSAIIPHGADPSEFDFQAEPEDYVCYLGRFTSSKGPRQAIAAARKLGLKLRMAGPNSPYFREQVEPLIDGKNIEYVGYLAGKERSRFLSGAKALLYPIQYPESFGLVLVESMLCGTPIAAMNLGAVPEVIDQGITGYHAGDEAGFLQAIERCMKLDRAQIRRASEMRFSARMMATAYAQLYQKIAKSHQR
jgi:glycosyltransferase involved in cell wall biosynthesis